MLHNGRSRVTFVGAIAPKTTGTRGQLANGQIGLLNTTTGKYINPLTKGSYGDAKFSLVVGQNSRTTGINSVGANQRIETVRFNANGVKAKDIQYPEPNQLNHIIIGYDGLNEIKSLPYTVGKSTSFQVTVMGEGLALFGVLDNEFKAIVSVDVPLADGDCPPTDCTPADCTTPTIKLVNQLRDLQIGTAKLKDFYSIAPILSCVSAPSTSNVNFYTLTVCDSGSDGDLAKIQATYSNPVVRVSRSGGSSVYQIMAASLPTAYTPTNPLTVLFDCATCPSGSTTVDGGFKYTVSLDDAGADLSATVETLANAVTGSAVKVGQNSAKGTYVVILSTLLSDANRVTFLAASATKATAIITYDTEVTNMCVLAAASAVAWVLSSTCTRSTQDFFIDLQDLCDGVSRLTELRAAYPLLTIVENTSPAPANCRRRYTATVNTNIVCQDACYTELYYADAPYDYDGQLWNVVVPDASYSDCLCGISLKQKAYQFIPPVCLADRIGVIKPVINIFIGNAITDTTLLESPFVQTPIESTTISISTAGTGWGYDLWSLVAENDDRQSGVRYEGQVSAYFLGNGIKFEFDKQYPVALVEVAKSYDSNINMDTPITETFNYQYVLEANNQALINFFNDLK